MKTLARARASIGRYLDSTMAGVRIRALTERHPIKPTSPRWHPLGQLNLGRHSTIDAKICSDNRDHLNLPSLITKRRELFVNQEHQRRDDRMMVTPLARTDLPTAGAQSPGLRHVCASGNFALWRNVAPTPGARPLPC